MTFYAAKVTGGMVSFGKDYKSLCHLINMADESI